VIELRTDSGALASRWRTKGYSVEHVERDRQWRAVAPDGAVSLRTLVNGTMPQRDSRPRVPSRPRQPRISKWGMRRSGTDI